MSEIFKWRKKPRSGRHNFSHGGVRHSILPGMVIEVPKYVLGAAVEKYDCLGLIKNPIDVTTLGSPPASVEGPAQDSAKELIIVPHGKSKTRYDIVNPDNPGKPLNTKSLKLDDAEKVLGKMLADLNGPKGDNFDFAGMDWDALANFMETAGIEIKDEYETEDDLRTAISEALK